VSDSDVNIDDDDVDLTKNYDLRNLEQFLDNTGLTFTPVGPTSISEVVNCFLGNNFLEILVEQSNFYHAQNADKNKNSSKSLAWNDVSITDMKKFLAIMILMGHVKKGKTRDYWNTNKLIETPVYCKLVNRNRFEQIWNFWHYTDSSTQDDEADIRYKMRPILDNLVEEIRRRYRSAHELLLDEAMIP
jgi:hypothetical protein